MMPTMAGAELKRALRVYFVDLGAPVTVESMASRPWASITFSGERHRLTLCLPGPGAEAAADTFLEGLEERANSKDEEEHDEDEDQSKERGVEMTEEEEAGRRDRKKGGGGAPGAGGGAPGRGGRQGSGARGVRKTTGGGSGAPKR